MKKHEIVEMPIADLVMADYNPRQWSEKERHELRTSLVKFGFVDPVLVNIHPKRKNVVIGGHFRTAMWKELGNDTVPCLLLKLTEAQERELNVRLNKNTGSWDHAKLLENYEVQDLLSFGFEQHEFGLLDAPPTLDLTGANNAPPPPLPNQQVAETAMVQLFFTTASKAAFMENIRILQEKYGTDNITDTTFKAIDDARASVEEDAH
jgi:ParB-like chromosome segregation protein Spo0J